MLMSVNTKDILIASESIGKKPWADSIKSKEKMMVCMMAGKGRRRAGSTGRPKEMEDRERKTVAW